MPIACPSERRTTVNSGATLDLGSTTQTQSVVNLSGGTIRNGNLNAPITSTGGVLNGGVSTQRFTNATTGSLVQDDMGTLACCDPTVHGDFGRRSGLAGVWTVQGGTPEPDELVENLIDVVFDPQTGLTAGQVNSLSDKLVSALASINDGLIKQAINQLNAFVSSVQNAVKTGKMDPGTGASLIAEANAIIALLQR